MKMMAIEEMLQASETTVHMASNPHAFLRAIAWCSKQKLLELIKKKQ